MKLETQNMKQTKNQKLKIFGLKNSDFEFESARGGIRYEIRNKKHGKSLVWLYHIPYFIFQSPVTGGNL